MNKIKYCNNCPNSSCRVSYSNGIYDYVNWSCKSGNETRCVDFSLRKDEKVPIPSWCPKIKTNEAEKPLTFSQKMDKFNEIKPMVNWADIKIGDVYHVPPCLSINNKRCDIEITSKSGISFCYRIIGPNESINNRHWLYQTSKILKILVKDKMKNNSK